MRTIIELLFTNACNRNCSYCVAKSRDPKYPKNEQSKNNEFGDYQLSQGIINIVQTKRWLLAMRQKFDDIRLVISGGEPTLLRHYTEFLDWCFENDFKKPILYTNGINLKDLTNCRNLPKEIVKVLLTHHLDSKAENTKEYVKFLKDLEIDFIVKLLTKGSDMREFGDSLECDYVVEGIRQLYPQDIEERAKLASKYYPMSGDSPYRWRWNGYGDIIDRRRTPLTKSIILSVSPTGLIFNCHLFNYPIGDIYELDFDENSSNIQLALCAYMEDFDLQNLKGFTMCEIQHYVNLFDGLPASCEMPKPVSE